MRAAASLRKSMVDRQIAARGVRDPHILAAMGIVPREAFVSADLRPFAYEDRPLPIAVGQTISQPYIVARMIAAAAIGPGDHVLEIGAGSGYAAAVMSRIAARVYAVERHGALAEGARERLARLGYGNVEIRTGDGTGGWPEAAPFDAILVAAGAPDIPRPLREQLRIGGRLVIPVGPAHRQSLVRVKRRSDTEYDEDDLGEVCFVPLIGALGWTTDDAPDPPLGKLGGGFHSSP